MSVRLASIAVISVGDVALRSPTAAGCPPAAHP